MPVLGTALIIICAGPSTFAGRFLGLGPMVGIGLISYSAYLWHQPLFAFTRIGSVEEPETGTMMALGLVALLLAWVSWRFIEKPFRNKAAFSRNYIFALSGAGMALFAGAGGVLVAVDGAPDRFPDYQQAWVSQSPAEQGAYVRKAYQQFREAGLSTDKRNVIIIGDSFSQDLANLITESSAFPNDNIIAYYVSAKCQIVMNHALQAAHIAANAITTCSKQKITEKRLNSISKADVVILASRWQAWAVEALPDTIAALALRPDQDLIIVGGKAFQPNIYQVLQVDQDMLADHRGKANSDHLMINARLRQLSPLGSFVDIQKIICDGDDCPWFTPSGELISHDGLHLTQAGAKFVGAMIFAQSPLNRYTTP